MWGMKSCKASLSKSLHFQKIAKTTIINCCSHDMAANSMQGSRDNSSGGRQHTSSRGCLAGFCYKCTITSTSLLRNELPLAFLHSSLLPPQYLGNKSNGFLFTLPLLNMAAMFSDSKRLLLAVVLLLVIAQASMETDNEIKEVPKITAPAPLVGAAAPPVRAPATAPPTGAPAPPINCKTGCGERCKLHSRPNVCMRACGTCCARCKCVPPGQSGNREVCGSCYTDWKTHNNQTKCP